MNLWRSPLAWQVTLFMGLQSTLFYVLVAWLPEILKSKGIGIDQSGLFVSIMQLTVLPVTFIAPILAGRMSNQRLLVTIASVCFFVGNVGLLYGSLNFIVLWIILLGMGAGFTFGLARTFFQLTYRYSRTSGRVVRNGSICGVFTCGYGSYALWIFT